MGVLSGANLVSLLQIMIDAEIAEMIARVVRGAEISLATMMAEAIEQVDFTGSYLSEKETARRPRAGEVYLPAFSRVIPVVVR